MQDTELQLLLHMLKILPQQRVKAVCLKQKSQSIPKVTEVLELGFDNASQIVQPSTAFKLLCLHPEHGSFSTQDLKSPQISDLQTSHWHRRAVTQLSNNLAAPDTARSLLTGFPSLSGSQNSGQKKPGSLEKPRSWPRPQQRELQKGRSSRGLGSHPTSWQKMQPTPPRGFPFARCLVPALVYSLPSRCWKYNPAERNS